MIDLLELIQMPNKEKDSNKVEDKKEFKEEINIELIQILKDIIQFNNKNKI